MLTDFNNKYSIPFLKFYCWVDSLNVSDSVDYYRLWNIVKCNELNAEASGFEKEVWREGNRAVECKIAWFDLAWFDLDKHEQNRTKDRQTKVENGIMIN